MRGGRRLAEAPSLGAICDWAATALAELPDTLSALVRAGRYPVDVAACVRRLADEVDAFDREQRED